MNISLNLLFDAKNKMKVDIAQVKYIMNGLKYHNSNINELYHKFQQSDSKYLIDNNEISKALIHETVAYLNRLGQFYYFAISNDNDVKQILTNPKSHLSFISKLMPFRMKQTAHRATDQNHKSDFGYDLDSLNQRFSYGTVTLNNLIYFDLYHNDIDKSITFEPLKDHAIIINEVETFIELLESNIYKEEASIINSDICKWLLNELYAIMFFEEGDSRLESLLQNPDYGTDEIRLVINHLVTIEWIRMLNYNFKSYMLNPNKVRMIEERGIIDSNLKNIVNENKLQVLRDIAISNKKKSKKISSKLFNSSREKIDFSTISREDLGKGIQFLSFYNTALKNSGHVNNQNQITTKGKNLISEDLSY